MWLQPSFAIVVRVSVTKRNYSQEAYYALSSSYFKKEFYLDDVFGWAGVLSLYRPVVRGQRQRLRPTTGLRDESGRHAGLSRPTSGL
jgi:hypothetical protein